MINTCIKSVRCTTDSSDDICQTNTNINIFYKLIQSLSGNTLSNIINISSTNVSRISKRYCRVWIWVYSISISLWEKSCNWLCKFIPSEWIYSRSNSRVKYSQIVNTILFIFFICWCYIIYICIYPSCKTYNVKRWTRWTNEQDEQIDNYILIQKENTYPGSLLLVLFFVYYTYTYNSYSSIVGFWI